MRTYYQGETIEVFLNSTETLYLDLCEDFAVYFSIGEDDYRGKVEKAEMDTLGDGTYRAVLTAMKTSDMPAGVYDIEFKYRTGDTVHIQKEERAFVLKTSASRMELI